jgi:Carboxymuconolactone decarboxylase family
VTPRSSGARRGHDRSLLPGAGKIGFVPNVFRAFGVSPECLRRWFAHYKQLRELTPSPDAAEREMIAVALSMANSCPASSPRRCERLWATRYRPIASPRIVGEQASTSAAPRD